MYNITDCLNFGVGEDSTSENNICLSSSENLQPEYEWLIFSDSRGLERDCNKSKTWLYLLCAKFDEQGVSYLVVSRPKNITVFATLINFLNLNEIKFNKLITNLGFVDCTPKKECFVTDIIEQIEMFFYENLSVTEFPKYLSSEGEMIKLYSLRYSNEYLKAVAKKIELSFASSYIITTPQIDISCVFSRKRPVCFYEQLSVTNNIIHKVVKLSGSNLIDIGNLKINTFDGVHFVKSDHTKLFELVCEEIL